MDILTKKEILKRRGVAFFLARSISNWGYKNLTKVHVEFNSDLRDLKKNKSVFLYTGLHRSLWETTGMLSALYFNKLPIPVVGMGDNLIKGKLFVTLAKNTSVFLVKRGSTRREIVESAKELKKNMYSFMAFGKDVLLFPEGTRTNIPRTGEYGGFFPTAFDALIEYENKNKDGTSNFIPYIIPFNCDYSIIREAHELTGYGSNTPRTLKVWDSLKMLRNIKDVYITFGSPVKVSDHLDKSRKEMAIMIRKLCLNLVKILPVNVVAKAIVESFNEEKKDMKSINDKIKLILSKLDEHKNCFRGFPDEITPNNIFKSVSASNPDFKSPSAGKLKIYKLYANYIKHYLPEV